MKDTLIANIFYDRVGGREYKALVFRLKMTPNKACIPACVH